MLCGFHAVAVRGVVHRLRSWILVLHRSCHYPNLHSTVIDFSVLKVSRGHSRTAVVVFSFIRTSEASKSSQPRASSDGTGTANPPGFWRVFPTAVATLAVHPVNLVSGHCAYYNIRIKSAQLDWLVASPHIST